MAKPKKDDSSRSILKLAFDAFERGDVVQARALAKAVLAGRVGRDDDKMAATLANTLSIEGAVVAETPAAVAQELVSRSIVPPKPYLFVAAAGGAFLLLMTLAILRY